MSSADAEAGSANTRARLLAAGLRLFAERGFSAVSVGEIERAVGLVPRRGALYRHFASKDELLEVAVRRHLESVAGGRARFVEQGADDLRASAYALATWALRELDDQYHITRVLERDGDRLPALRDTFRREVSDRSYAAMADMLRGWLGTRMRRRARSADVDALAVLLLGALVNLRRSTWTLGQPPSGLDDERAARSWADLCARVTG